MLSDTFWCLLWYLNQKSEDKKSAIRQIEKIKKCIRSSHYLQGEKSPVKITASFGVAIYPEDVQTKKDLLLKADHFMYEVKNTTKDGIASAWKFIQNRVSNIRSSRLYEVKPIIEHTDKA